MELTVAKITGLCAIPGATGVKVATSECSAMARARNLVARTSALKMVMLVRVTPLPAHTVENVASSLRHLIQQACEQPLSVSECQRCPDFL